MIDSVIRSMGRAPLVLALILALVFLREGFGAFEVFKEKAEKQGEVTESVDRWKSSYRALAGAVKQWDKSYQTEDSIQDMVSLIDAVALNQYGFDFNIDSVTVSKTEAVTNNAVPIGLTKVCLATGMNADGLEVKAKTYEELLTGLKKLSARPDVYIGTIKIKSVNRTQPAAVLGDFCLLLRKGNGR